MSMWFHFRSEMTPAALDEDNTDKLQLRPCKPQHFMGIKEGSATRNPLLV
jgi:hypothetical protein